MSASLLLILWLAANAEAGVKLKRSGASRAATAELVSCVDNAVLGSNEGICLGKAETEACVGLQKSLEFSQKKTVCLRLRGLECAEWGNEGKAQAQWVSIAAAHLARFGNCVRNHYGSEENNGFEEARSDEGFIQLLKKIDDGSRHYRLKESEVLVRSLHGDRFSQILAKSPLAKEIPAGEFFTLKDAADTPAVLEALLISEQELAEEEGAPVQPQVYAFKPFAISYPDQKKSTTQSSDAESASPVSNFSPVRELASKSVPEAGKSFPSQYSLGLDRTLFERISATYLRRQPELRGTDDFIRQSRPTPAKDIGELVSRGGGL